MANFNFNKVVIGGRLTADPELKTTPNGVSVCTFSVAVNRPRAKEGTQSSDFFTVTAWRTTAEFITRYFRKASSICIDGSLQTKSWTDQNGQKRFATEIVAEEAYFVDSRDEMPIQANAPTGTEAQTYIPQAYLYDDTPKFDEIKDDEDLPF